MNAALRQDYLALLAAHGIKPHAVPANAPELRVAILKRKIAASRDKTYQALHREKLEEELRKIATGESEQNERHPSELAIDGYRDTVEQAVKRSARYAPLYGNNAYVGEFPTGSVNAEARRTGNGYLILVNSGLPFFIKQVTEALNAHEDVTRAAKSTKTVDLLARILIAYLRFGDPVFGPKPMTADLIAMRSLWMSDACCEFVVAHEYGHVLAGHLDAGATAHALPTRAGAVDVIRKAWDQEFEADRIGYELTIGGSSEAEVDLDVIDRGRDHPQPRSVEYFQAMQRGAKLMAALTAPLYLFELESLLIAVWETIHDRDAATRFSSTHPPSHSRRNAIGEAMAWIPKHHMRYIAFPWVLGEMTSAVAKRAATLVAKGF
jgi:hypothetical protein